MMEFRRGKTGSLKGSARGRDAVAVLLSEAELAVAEVPSGPLAGFEARLVALSPEATPEAATLGWARAIVIETDGKTRSEEHTSELPSLMRISYAVFCLKKKNNQNTLRKSKHK